MTSVRWAFSHSYCIALVLFFQVPSVMSGTFSVLNKSGMNECAIWILLCKVEFNKFS